MTQTNNRFFDEVAKLMNDAAGVAGGVRREFDTMMRTQAERILRELDSLERDIDYYVLPPLCPLKGSPYDFSHTAELIARAVESTDAWLAVGGMERPRTHTQLGLHKHSH